MEGIPAREASGLRRAGVCLLILFAGSVAGCGSSVATLGSSSSGGGTSAVTSTSASTSTSTSASTESSTSSSTGSSSSGATGTGTSGSGTSGSSGSTSSTGTTSGTTGGPPYQGFDAGPRPEPPIDVDAGCSAVFPYFLQTTFGSLCVQCRTDSDCGSGLFCTPEQAAIPFICAPCRDDGGVTIGCPAGLVCLLQIADGLPPQCVADCRDGGISCVPGLCEPDSGLCIAGACLDVDDCFLGDGGGICNTLSESSCQGCGVCQPCFPDGGGCTQPNDICDLANGGCVPNCLDSGIKCQPTFMCTSAGTCAYGCQSDNDCDPVHLPFCQKDITPPTCGQCRGAADCPGWMPGCTNALTCPNCANLCGQCDSQNACPAGLHCGFDIFRCGCTSTAECQAALPNEPVCIGLEDDGGSPLGACACLTSADCATGQVCETRLPYQVRTYDLQGNPFFGGACIANCTDAGETSCASALIPGSTVCNSATGYCVPCVGDSDCAVNASQPITRPNCVPYLDGGAPPSNFVGPTLATGGGQCGCTSTASCDEGLTCADPSTPGACQAPCTFVDGLDSCLQSSHAFCDTFTGLCQECLRDFDCTNISGAPNNLAFSSCAPDGVCVQCTDSSQCPANLPGCSSGPPDPFNYIPQGTCGFCKSSADCPSNGGLVCARFKEHGGTQCLSPCLLGDDAGMGSVSDAGAACPAALPYCVQAAFARSDAGSWCGECRGDGDCDAGQLCCNNFCLTGFYCPS
jgi:hypothetical protein